MFTYFSMKCEARKCVYDACALFLSFRLVQSNSWHGPLIAVSRRHNSRARHVSTPGSDGNNLKKACRCSLFLREQAVH